MDSSYNIINVENKGDLSFYYFDIRDLKYRIFVESVAVEYNIGLHVGFEFKSEDRWITYGQTHELKQSEGLKLFGTIYKVIKSLTFNSISLKTEELKKEALYFRMMHSLVKKLGKGEVIRDNGWIYIIVKEGLLNNTKSLDVLKSKWKYKK